MITLSPGVSQLMLWGLVALGVVIGVLMWREAK